MWLHNTSGVAKVTISLSPVHMEQTISSMAMKETTLSMAVDTESTKPSKVVKVMTKSMLLLKSTSRTTVKVTCW